MISLLLNCLHGNTTAAFLKSFARFAISQCLYIDDFWTSSLIFLTFVSCCFRLSENFFPVLPKCVFGNSLHGNILLVGLVQSEWWFEIFYELISTTSCCLI